MRTPRAIAMILFAMIAVGLSAQTGSPTRSPNPAAAPGEPDIVMPQVILQIEDLSVEKVEAQLPPDVQATLAGISPPPDAPVCAAWKSTTTTFGFSIPCSEESRRVPRPTAPLAGSAGRPRQRDERACPRGKRGVTAA